MRTAIPGADTIELDLAWAQPAIWNASCCARRGPARACSPGTSGLLRVSLRQATAHWRWRSIRISKVAMWMRTTRPTVWSRDCSWTRSPSFSMPPRARRSTARRFKLLDATTGALAQVFSNDGVTPYPASIVTGEPVRDAAGNEFDYGPGASASLFSPRAPIASRSNRRLGSCSVSGGGRGDCAASSWAPIDLGSREAFDVDADDQLIFDVPVDPITAEIFLSKQAAQRAVAIGDFLQYPYRFRTQGAAADDITLVDTLPVDSVPVRSVRVDGQPVAERESIPMGGPCASISQISSWSKRRHPLCRRSNRRRRTR